MSITSEAKTEVTRLLQRGQKLRAVKFLCDRFSLSLAESKTLVDTLEKEIAINQVPPEVMTATDQGVDGPLRQEVIALLQLRKKIEAVKKVKTALNTGLKEALVIVENIQKDVDPNYRSLEKQAGCRGNVFLLVGGLFGLLGLIFLAVAGTKYNSNLSTIANSEQITGRVVEMRRPRKGSSQAPVIAYTWQGQDRLYYSTTYTTPPSFELNEQVPLFVDRDDPAKVVVDTFSGRWLVIVIFGGLGGFFTLFAAIFVFVGRKL